MKFLWVASHWWTEDEKLWKSSSGALKFVDICVREPRNQKVMSNLKACKIKYLMCILVKLAKTHLLMIPKRSEKENKIICKNWSTLITFNCILVDLFHAFWKADIWNLILQGLIWLIISVLTFLMLVVSGMTCTYKDWPPSTQLI